MEHLGLETDPRSLASFELACRDFRDAVASAGLWQRAARIAFAQARARLPQDKRRVKRRKRGSSDERADERADAMMGSTFGVLAAAATQAEQEAEALAADAAAAGGPGTAGDHIWKAALVDFRFDERLLLGDCHELELLGGPWLRADGVLRAAAAAPCPGGPGVADVVAMVSALRCVKVVELRYDASAAPGAVAARELFRLSHPSYICAVAAVSPSLVVTATIEAAHLWRDGQLVRPFPVTVRLCRALFSTVLWIVRGWPGVVSMSVPTVTGPDPSLSSSFSPRRPA